MNNFSVCCVCFIHVKNANSSHLTSIFDKGGKVASMMFYLTGIAPVEVNGLEPSLICNECADELKVANCLRKKIVEGQKFLRSKRQKLEVEWIAREKKAYNKNFPVSDFKLSQSMKNKIIKIYPHLRKKLSKENTSPKINLSSVVIKKPTSPPIINTVASLEPKKEKFVPFTSKLIKNIDVRQSVLKFECDSCDASFLSFFEFQEHNKTHTRTMLPPIIDEQSVALLDLPIVKINIKQPGSKLDIKTETVNIEGDIDELLSLMM